MAAAPGPRRNRQTTGARFFFAGRAEHTCSQQRVFSLADRRLLSWATREIWAQSEPYRELVNARIERPLSGPPRCASNAVGRFQVELAQRLRFWIEVDV